MKEFFDIRSFGAKGNGRDMDSGAIQAAFDAAAASGGGTVLVPPGTYRAVNLELRDNLTIRLAAGATIQGSEDIADYVEDKDVNPLSLQHYMISGRNVSNVTIEGDGILDGSGESFWEEELCNGVVRTPKEKRPVMLYCVDCRNVTIRNIRIENAAVYTVWLLGCEDVRIDGVVIRNDYKGPNTDALDIDCCRNVIISNCDIIAGDDCLAIKSDIYRLGRNMPCENIAVSNCLFSSSTCAVRIGYEGDGVIRDCLICNMIFYKCAKGVAMQSLIPDMSTEFTKIEQGTIIENISFQNIIMRDVDRAFFIWTGNEAGKNGYRGSVRNINISDIQGTVNKESYIGGVDDYYISGLRLLNIRLSQTGDLSGIHGEIPGVWGHSGFPHATLALRYIDDVRINDLEISGENPLAWKYLRNGFHDGVRMPENKNIQQKIEHEKN